MTAATLSAFDAELSLLVDDATAVAYTLRREAESLRAEGARNGLHAAHAIQQLRDRVATLSRDMLPGHGEFSDELPHIAQLRSELDRLRVELPLRALIADARRISGSIAEDDQRQLDASLSVLDQRLTGATLSSDDRPLDAHPLAALLRLIQLRSDLNDDDWEADQQVVRAEFGATLAVAAARGRLALREISDESRSSDEPS